MGGDAPTFFAKKLLWAFEFARFRARSEIRPGVDHHKGIARNHQMPPTFSPWIMILQKTDFLEMRGA